MRNPLFSHITRAIDAHELLIVTDEAGDRLIEPYLIYESKAGDMLLHSWQRSGAFRSSPPPRFCNLYLEDLIAVQRTGQSFRKPHRDYNPVSSQFHRVIYQLDEAGPQVPPKSAASTRVRPKRRGPPGSRSSTSAGRRPRQ
jgi:hypothetical protein